MTRRPHDPFPGHPPGATTGPGLAQASPSPCVTARGGNPIEQIWGIGACAGPDKSRQRPPVPPRVPMPGSFRRYISTDLAIDLGTANT